MIAFGQIPQFSALDVAYAAQDPRLKPFITHFPTEENVGRQIIAKMTGSAVSRQVLADTLNRQYNGLSAHQRVISNIELLRSPNTFTITTAHQPNLFSGPLYSIYKILHTIRFADELNKKYDTFKFVPVYWMGADDHDFEELNHINLFDKRVEWVNKQGGALGHYTNEGMAQVVEELGEILGGSVNAKSIMELIHGAYTENRSYGEAHAFLMNELFGPWGLVVLNPLDREFRKLLTPIFTKELIERKSSDLVRATAEKIAGLGFKVQTNPREINLFYLSKNSRERIIFEEGKYKINNTVTVFDEEGIMTELFAHPERFSPNVILRPLCQETILPNVAFIGGGAEIAYWMEQKSLFEDHKVDFPILVRRSSFLLTDENSNKKIAKLGLSALDLFQDLDSLNRAFIQKQESNPLDLESVNSLMTKAFSKLLDKAAETDATLVPVVEAEKVKQLKAVEQLAGRLYRGEKLKHETSLAQIATVKQKWFPKNNLQERHESFLPFYLKAGSDLFVKIYENVDLMGRGFKVMSI